MSSQAGNVVTERGAKVERNGSKPEIGRIVFFLSTSSPRQNDMYRKELINSVSAIVCAVHKLAKVAIWAIISASIGVGT